MIDREKNWDSLTTLLQHVLFQWAKDCLHTAMPGIIETYDPATRRARVRPALRIVLTEDAGGEELDRAPAVNVPVIFPASAGYTMLFPLAEGDPVMLLFSERGLTEFKLTFETATPDRTRFFSESDGVALTGFGALAATPASLTGALLQTTDGNRSVRVEEDRVELYVGSTFVRVEDDEITVDSPGDVRINVPGGSNVHVGGAAGEELVTKTFLEQFYNQHIHATSMGPSGPPVAAAPLAPGNDLTEKQLSE